MLLKENFGFRIALTDLLSCVVDGHEIGFGLRHLLARFGRHQLGLCIVDGHEIGFGLR